MRRLVCLVVMGFVAAGFARSWTFADDKPAAKADAVRDAKKLAEEKEYYELLRLFADTLDQVERNYVKDVSRRELMEAAIHGMLTKLDPYSNFIPPTDLDRFKSGVESEFGGVGIQISIDDGIIKVVSPLVDTPAFRAGIKAGDRIVEIEGKSTKGVSIDEAVQRMKGKPGSQVTVKVLHAADNKTESVTLTREVIRVRTVLGDRRDSAGRWDYWLEGSDKIGYVRITAFSRHTTGELEETLKELVAQGLKGLILDLRFNPGGLLSSAIEISDLFIADGRIVSTEGRSAPKRVWDARKDGTYEGFPMVVLVNEFSASASEIVAACLQDHQRAVVIGERTWGKGSVQNIIELEDGKSALKLTTAGYVRPSGKNIHKFEGAKSGDEWGVSPNTGFEMKLSREETGQLIDYRRDRDVAQVEPKPEKDPKFADRQLQKAGDHLREKLKPESKPEPAKTETAKPEPAKTEPAKTEPAKTEAPSEKK